MSFSFGTRSTEQLKTCHEDLQKILELAIQSSKVDFGISEGHRTVLRQYELFLMGRSKIDGVTRKGKHNKVPSMAADIFIYHPDTKTRRQLAYDISHLCYVAGVIDSCAKELLEQGEISHAIRWGGNWDSDGIIAIDQTFDDYPHFELIEI